MVRLTPLVVLLLLTGCAASQDKAAAPLQLTPTPTQLPAATPSSTPSPTPVATRPPTPTSTPTPQRSVGWSSRRVTAADLPHSWRPGCPVAPSQLRLLTVPYLGFDGRRHTGHLVVRASAVSALGRTFDALYAQRFPIRSIRLVDDFGGSDDDSMAADNTSAFNCRQAVGGSGWSQHAYGLAVDVNPRENPYVRGDSVLPPEGRPYVDRTPTRPGMLSDRQVRAFAAIGWRWGGYWKSSKDYQHFSSNGR